VNGKLRLETKQYKKNNEQKDFCNQTIIFIALFNKYLSVINKNSDKELLGKYLINIMAFDSCDPLNLSKTNQKVKNVKFRFECIRLRHMDKYWK
jgi:hypothetical protein